MPNKIFVPLMNTLVNPSNIKKQAARKQQKVDEKRRKQMEVSKESASASKAYASMQIKKSEPAHFQEIRLLETGLKAKENAKNVYLTSFDELRKIDGRKILKEAKQNGFEPIIDEEGNVKKIFEYKKRQGKKPDVLAVYEYDNDMLVKKIVLKDNGIYVSSIEYYDGLNFEQMKFVTGPYRGSDIYEYSKGINTEYGIVTDAKYRYSNRTFGQIAELQKGIRTTASNIKTTNLIIRYDEKGKCKTAQEHVVDKSGTIINLKPEINFQSEDNFYVIDVK